MIPVGGRFMMPPCTVRSSRSGSSVRRNESVVLIVAFSGGCLIGTLVTGMLLSPSDIVVEQNVVQSAHTIEPATVADVSLMDVVESGIETGSDSSTMQSKTGASGMQSQTSVSELDPMPVLAAIERSPQKHSLQMILEQPLTGESETALLHNLQTWSDTEPVETALWIERTLSEASPDSTADALVYPLLYQWVEIEPEVALAQLGAYADEDEVPYLMLSHAERLAEQQTPAEALEWARSMEDKASREVVVDGLLQSWLESDVAALATQLELENPALRYGADTADNTALDDKPADSLITDNFKELVATALIEQDPARALQWADALPGAGAEDVRSEVIDSWMAQDPVAASDWLSGVLADTGTLPVSLASIVPQRDIDLAINTLPLLSDASRGAMTSAIVETLSEVDPDHARAWVDGLVDPEDRSAAVTVWAMANARRQPVEALDGALESTSGQARLDTLVNVAATIAQFDQPLLESWLAAASLSDYERSQIASVVFEAEVYPFQ